MVIRIAPSDAGRPAGGPARTPRGQRGRGQRSAGTPVAAVLRRLVAACFVAAGVLALAGLVLTLNPAQQRARVTLDIQGAAAQEAAGRYAALPGSRPVVEQLIGRPDLQFDIAQSLQVPVLQRLARMLNRIRGEPVPALDPGHLQAAISAQSPTPARLDISVAARDRDSAVRLANAVADVTAEAIRSTATPADARAAALLARVSAADAALKQARAVAGRRDEATDPARREAIYRQRAAEQKQRYETVQAALAAGRDAETIAASLGRPALDRMVAQLREARAQAVSLRARLGTTHASVIAAEANVAEKMKLLSEAVRLEAAAARADAQTLASAAASGQSLPAGSLAAPDSATDALEKAAGEARQAYETYAASQPGSGIDVRIASPAVAETPQQGWRGLIWVVAALVAGLAFIWAVMPLFSRKMRSLRSPASPLPTPEAPAEIHPPTANVAPLRPITVPEMPVTDDPTRVSQAAGAVAPGIHPVAIGEIAAEISDRGWSTALQTVLVTGEAAQHAATAALELGVALAARHLRVLLVDADDDAADLSRRLHDAPLSGTLPLNGRPRLLATLDTGRHGPIWFVPAGTRAAPRDVVLQPEVVPGVAGHFDVVVLAGPARTDAAAPRLAQAADLVVLAGHGIQPDWPAVRRDALRHVSLSETDAAAGGRVLRL